MSKALGDFLQARRSRLKPADVGVVSLDGRRRVPGLRRDELAQLSGVSVEYYTRLEQGRARNVSDEVLGALASALKLEPAESRYLFQLARPRRAQADAGPLTPDSEPVRPELQRLLDGMTTVPAVVVDHLLRVRAANALGRALFELDDYVTDRERQMRCCLAFRIFLDPSSRDWLPDWPVAAAAAVAYLRLQAGQRRDEQRLMHQIGQLSVDSPDFRRLWADHDVRTNVHSSVRFYHPVIGEVGLYHEILCLPDDPELAVHTYTATTAASAQQLSLLASWTADPAAAAAPAAPSARRNAPERSDN